MKYVVHEGTFAIIGCRGRKTKVIEEGRVLEFSCSWREILNESCLQYGSSLQGRLDGSKYLLEKGYKTPILISDTKELIFFPLTNIQEAESIWISFSNIIKYSGNKDETTVYFKEGEGVSFPISNYVFDSQFLKAYRLEKMVNFIHKNCGKM